MAWILLAKLDGMSLASLAKSRVKNLTRRKFCEYLDLSQLENFSCLGALKEKKINN